MKEVEIEGEIYRLPNELNDFQFNLFVHLIKWKWNNVTKDAGRFKELLYDAILPESEQKNLPHLYNQATREALEEHLKIYPFKPHPHFFHMASSQAANINLFIPLLLHPLANEILRQLKPDFKRLATEELYHGFRLEFWDGNSDTETGSLGDHNSIAGTDADIAIAYYNKEDKLCLWLIEHKLREAEFTDCGGYNSNGRNPHHDCKKTFAEILQNKDLCYYHSNCKYEYWNITDANQSFFINHDKFDTCPFKGGMNQLWRNQLLGFTLEEQEKYREVYFSIVRHPENDSLNDTIANYKKLIAGNPNFSDFTSRDVVDAASKFEDKELGDWVKWYRGLYNIKMSNKITAEIKKINKVLEKQLTIPVYQRPYRWQEENVRLLLKDIYDSWKSGKRSYRIGSVILYKKNRYDQYSHIVDGQQRITTILLILNVLKSEVGKAHLVSLKYEHIESKNNIVQNNKFIEKWIEETIGNEILDFCKYLTEYCEFVEIVVPDLSEAFQMFDSQNGRGKELEAYNLLKAFHIRAMDIETQETKIECDRIWESSTRFKKNKDDENENPFDLLKQVFNEQLYRTRVWSRKEEAFVFNKQKIFEFKGLTLNKNAPINYPFQNIELLQFIANKYFESLGLGIKGIKSRFAEAKFENINPFVQINQNIFNGKPFFDYIETYVEIYKQLFRYSDRNNQLIEFEKFYKTHCKYTGSKRTGDKYLKELYKSLIFLMFDKYGEEGVNKYYKILYILVYRLRLIKKQVKYAAVAKYPLEENLNLFSIIENSQSYLDLQKLEKNSRKPIDCNMDVKVIIQFFQNFDIDVRSTDSSIKNKLDTYKSEIKNGNN